MANLDYAFSSIDCNDNFSNSFTYLDDYNGFVIDESTLLNRRHINKEVIFDNDEIQIEYYKYDNSHLDYITNYIYPFWKLEFLNKHILDSKNTTNNNDEFNPYSKWSNSELAKHNMGLRDNSICFELKTAGICIGFCNLLLLDNFDREGFNSIFSDTIYDHSILLYNFIIEKAFRGNGYGNIFMDRILTFIHKSKHINLYKYIVLYVDKDNVGAKKVYQSKGFKYVCDNPKNQVEEIYKVNLLN